MSYDSNNIFAKIIRGEIPCNKVYENDHVLAFRDIAPLAPTHILIIPKGAYISSDDFSANASDAEIIAFWRAVGDIGRQEGVDSGGYRLISNHGAHANQEVLHFHMHLVGGRQLRAGIVPKE